MSIRLKLSKPDNRYIAGELLQGTVTIDNENEKKVRSVYILVKGAADVRWTEQESYRENNETRYRSVTYSSHEQYLDSQTVLFGNIGGPTVKLPAGSHTYTFACALPERLPGTMSSDEADIKYKVKLVMDIPWGIDESESQPFEVVNVIDLNQNGTLRYPIRQEEIKSFCLCSCNPNDAVVTVTIPKGGFVPNEEIPIHCNINNKTSVEFYGATFTLQRVVTAITVSPGRRERETKDNLVEENYSATQETRNKETEFTYRIKVPICAVSCHYAAYIQTNYFVIAEMATGGCHSNVKCKIPIEIGTIPVGASGYTMIGDVISLAPMPGEASALPITPSAPPAADRDPEKVPLADEEPPPPTYAEATHNEKDAEAHATAPPEAPSGGNNSIGWNVNSNN